MVTLNATDVRLGRHVLFYLSSLCSRGKKIENDSSWFAKTAICQNVFIACSRNHLLILKKTSTTSTDCTYKSLTNATHVFEQEINKWQNKLMKITLLNKQTFVTLSSQIFFGTKCLKIGWKDMLVTNVSKVYQTRNRTWSL